MNEENVNSIKDNIGNQEKEEEVKKEEAEQSINEIDEKENAHDIGLNLTKHVSFDNIVESGDVEHNVEEIIENISHSRSLSDSDHLINIKLEQPEQNSESDSFNSDDNPDDIKTVIIPEFSMPPIFTKSQLSLILRGFYEIVLWKRPFSMFVILIFTEILFYLIYILELDTLATITLVLIFIHFAKFILTIIPSSIKKCLFPPLTVDSVSRITPSVKQQITEKHNQAIDVLKKGIQWLNYYIHSPSLIDSFLLVGTLILIFTIFWVVGSFWTLFIATHILVIVPVLYFNPFYVRKMVDKIQEAKGAVIQKDKNE